MASRRWGGLLLGLGACATAAEEPDLLGQSSAIVYGNDDREDVYAVDDAELQAIARNSLVALLPTNRLHRPRSGSVRIVAPNLQETYSLCEEERFLAQPTAAECSGVLIDDDLVLTAGHCFDSADHCDDFAYLFDYYYEAEGKLARLTSTDVYGCRRVVQRVVSSSSSPTQIDYAVVQLDRPAFGRKPVPLRLLAFDEGESVTTMGFASGLPAKIDRGASVIASRAAMLDYFKLDSDTFAGSSGSGIFDSDNRLSGLLVRGGDDYSLDSAAGCYVPNVIADGQNGAPWEHATYVKRAVDGVCELGWPSVRLCGVAPRCGDGFCTHDEVLGSCAADCENGSCGPNGCGKAVDLPILGGEGGEQDAGIDEPATGGDSGDAAGLDGPEKPGQKGKGCSVAALHGTSSPGAPWALGVALWFAARRSRRKGA